MLDVDQPLHDLLSWAGACPPGWEPQRVVREWVGDMNLGLARQALRQLEQHLASEPADPVLRKLRKALHNVVNE